MSAHSRAIPDLSPRPPPPARPGLRRFLLRCLNTDGSFCMHDGGEVDIRGAYCAAAVARLTNVYDDPMFEKTAEWLSRCAAAEMESA